MNMSKKVAAGILVGLSALAGNAWAVTNGTPDTIILKDGKEMKLEQSWDKIFPKSDRVDHRKVMFTNRYGITLAGDLYMPKGAEGKLAVIAVSGPFGAVKEQASGLYAQTMAERGFLTLAMWRPRTSIPKISARRWISLPPWRTWMRGASASSAYAVSAAWG